MQHWSRNLSKWRPFAPAECRGTREELFISLKEKEDVEGEEAVKIKENDNLGSFQGRRIIAVL